MGFALSISSTLLFPLPAGLAAQESLVSAPDYAVLRKGNSQSTPQVGETSRAVHGKKSGAQSCRAWTA